MTRRRYFTPEEEAEIRRLYPDYPTLLIAQELDRTVESVYRKANSMGLRKSPEYLKKYGGQIQPGQRRGTATEFRKGQTPYNKGKRMAPEVRAKCAPTMFKKGRRPEDSRNYKPIGSTRIVYGNLERKTTDDPTIYPARRWAPVHRLVWETANGPVPDGHIVVFRQGRHTTVEDEITLDRLECIPLAENMRRNSVHNYPEPIKRALRAKASLSRAINKRQRA